MPVWLIAFCFAVGAAGFVYSKLVRSNGGALKVQDMTGAAIAGVGTYIVLYTFFKYVLNF